MREATTTRFIIVGLFGLGAAGCLGATGSDEIATAGATAPIETQATWKAAGEACPDGLLALGVDDDASEDGRAAVCVHHDFCAARPSGGGYCAAAPKTVLTTDPATFWSDFLIDCPAVGRMVAGTEPGTAQIRIPDANAAGGARVYTVDQHDVHTRAAAAGGWEPCLTNPVGAGLRDATCDAGNGTFCSLDGDAVVDCVPTWVDDHRGGESNFVQRVEALSRRTCASAICEALQGGSVACQEDRALVAPFETVDERGEVSLQCAPGRFMVAMGETPMCIGNAFCAARTTGLYCDGAPSGVTNTNDWGDLDPHDAIAPGSVVVVGPAAVQCGRDAAGRATTSVFPCASGTCVGNGVGFGCVDTSCETRNADTDLESLYWSGTDEAIEAVEGKYCSAQRDATLLDCQLVQLYDASIDSYTIRLLPQSLRRCTGATPICEEREAGVADACVAVDPAAAD